MISLVIPTYNRPQFLGRLLDYYRQVKFPHRIVVADSSDVEVVKANEELVASVKNGLEIDHLVYSSDTPFITKLIQVLGVLDAKYVVLCADDDFITPKGIEQGAAYLDAHDDYSVASGGITVVTAHSHANGDPRYGLLSYTYAQRTIDDADPSLRLRNHLANYTTTFYSVHRRLKLLRNLRLAHEATKDYRFGELLPSCLSLVQGKVICLDVLYMVRQAMSDSTAGKISSWPEMLTEADYPERYASFRDCLVEELKSVSHLSEQDATEAVNRAFQTYLSFAVAESSGTNGYSANERGSGMQSYRQLSQRFKRVMQTLPAAARAAFIEAQMLSMLKAPRAAYRHLRWKRDEMSMDALLDERSRFHGDFLPIYECLGRYPDGIAAPLSQSCVKTIELSS